MINLYISGNPRPQGRPRAYSRGKFTQVVSPVTQWRNDCKYAFIKHKEDNQLNTITSPLIITLNFYFDRAKSHFGTGKNSDKIKPTAPLYPTSSRLGDVDNLSKAVMDAMVDAGLLDDDKLVVSAVINKMYVKPGQQPGVYVSTVIIKDNEHG